MSGRSPLHTRPKPEKIGKNILAVMANLTCVMFAFAILIFTLIAAIYKPEDPHLSQPTFTSDHTIAKTSDDYLNLRPSTQTGFSDDGASNVSTSSGLECVGNSDEPIDCINPEVFHLMMRVTIEMFKDVHFYKFGKPVRGSNSSTCDMAWRYRPKEGNLNADAFNKDYRRFVISRNEDCSFNVVGVGEYHTGLNARKPKKGNQRGFEKMNTSSKQAESSAGVVGGLFSDRKKYLVYTGGGDRCKSMNHYLWSLSCALGEARYLNRTFVMDFSVCLSSKYTASNQDEEGKDFRFYFDLKHLMDSGSVTEQGQFWFEWEKWERRGGQGLYLVEDFRVTPMKLADVKDALIMRKFGLVEPDNYWYRVCEGETESVIHRPWHMLWKSRRLMDIVSGITSRMNSDFDSVHVVRGERAKNTELWPNLAADTSPNALLSSLQNKIEQGRDIYIATNEPNTSFFDPLMDKYGTHFLDDYKDLWNESSVWYEVTRKLNNGIAVEFDGYMRISVDTEVFLRGKKRIETFNDLTSDCKEGINACPSIS
ncbi:hypothetical protein Scep_013538 [Stephania cephalantha]|uniref:O-fucosyltransferase family protein n=1 Tax=Stephania cephalantha TaxID=152367 RepID=A0AAP0JJB5_9MAGN